MEILKCSTIPSGNSLHLMYVQPSSVLQYELIIHSGPSHKHRKMPRSPQKFLLQHALSFRIESDSESNRHPSYNCQQTKRNK